MDGVDPRLGHVFVGVAEQPRTAGPALVAFEAHGVLGVANVDNHHPRVAEVVVDTEIGVVAVEKAVVDAARGLVER